MNDSFTAIDFETAHGKRWSICQVGLVQVEDGRIKKELSMLIQPPENYYWSNFTDIHGISAKHTRTAATFDKVWHQLAPYVNNQNLVAHNGAFDFHCLKQTLEYYSIAVPSYTGHCTYKIFKDNLAALCRKHRIPLNHHDALSDALACARLYLLHLNQTKS
ncbi:exonuclease domain-containing protein [Mucilaginibacter sp.]